MPRGRPRKNDAASPRAAAHGRAAAARASLPFNRKLALNQWLLGLFGVERFDQLAAHLKDESLEGLDADNIHNFHRALCLHLPAETRPELPDALLLEYDQAIVSVTQRLNDRRITRGEEPIVWKYFQTIGSSPRVMRRSLRRCVTETMAWSYSKSSASGSSGRVSAGRCRHRARWKLWMLSASSPSSDSSFKWAASWSKRSTPNRPSSHWLRASLRLNGNDARAAAARPCAAALGEAASFLRGRPRGIRQSPSACRSLDSSYGVC